MIDIRSTDELYLDARYKYLRDCACWYIDKLNEEAGAEVFGFCLDIGHANVVRRDFKNFIIKLGHRLTCLHIHNNDGENDTHAMPFTRTVRGVEAFFGLSA